MTQWGNSMTEAEIVGFDGDGVVIEGGVSPDVLDEAQSRKEAFKRNHPPEAEPPALEDYIIDVLSERGELPVQQLVAEFSDVPEDVVVEALNRRRAFKRNNPNAEPPSVDDYIQDCV